MDRNVRYQLIPNENTVTPDVIIPVQIAPSDSATMIQPEEERQADASLQVTGHQDNPVVDSSNMEEGPSADSPKYSFAVPPTYNVAIELPSYDEVQRMKLEEEEGRQTEPNSEGFVDPFGGEDGLLGTDLIFLSAFCVSFLFSWIGFVLLMCFCHTIAGRYGALSGFGLSLAKWTLIIKHSTVLLNPGNSWLGWLVLAFGILICVRSFLQYVHIKREWRLLNRAAQERLLYFT